MILFDVNILVYAHRADAPNHADYKQWLENRLGSPESCGVSDLVLSGCLRVITHPKVFLIPTPVDQAFRFVEQIRSHPNVRIMSPGPAHWSIFSDLCKSINARGNFVPDAYHAALAIETGCEWATTDRGFARFPKLKLRHPLDK